MDLIEIFNNHFPKISQKQIILFLILSILLAAVLIFMVQRKIIKTGQAVCIAGVFVWLYIVFLSTVFSRNPYPEMKYELMPFLVLCFYHTESQRIHGRGNIFECTSADAHGSAAVRGIWQTFWDDQDNCGRICSVVLY